MHPNPIYRGESAERHLAFVRAQGFGTLAVVDPAGAMPILSHVPLILDEAGGCAQIHLVRSNPIARLLNSGPVPARLAVTGPHGYISPDWYEIPDQVPTWNYVAVHLSGMLSLQDPATLRDLLDRQSALYESRLSPKPAWTTAKMTPQVLERMMRQIVPVALDITEIDGTWKLSQNKSAEARLGAADGIEAAGFGQETGALAGLMRDTITD